MKSAKRTLQLGLVAIAIIAAPYTALANNFQPRGHIQNDQGQRCSYTQTTVEDSVYFHGTLTGRMGTITFDDPRCMSASELGLDVNKMMINNVIARWHSHPDAAFKTRIHELYPTSMMQKRGLCIQSGKYPGIGITVDYEIQGNSIARVRHGGSIQGCQS